MFEHVDKRRITAAMIFMFLLGIGFGYVLWGDWDNLPGASSPVNGRAEFAGALQERFDSFTLQEHQETCQSVKAEGLAESVAFIRERHYNQPGGARMPFYDDIAEKILSDECLTAIA